MSNEEQSEEMEALRSIFDKDLIELTADPPCFMIRLTNIEVPLPGPVSLKFTFPVSYPNESPKIELPMRSRVIRPEQIEQIMDLLHECAIENLGMPMIYTLVDTAQQWINDNVTHDQADEEGPKEENLESLERKTTNVKLEEPKTTGGKWDYVIGLVGKPSAGKSTFFNAATNHDCAKTGSHPFTTIEPNIGKAFYSVPCPCSTRLKQACDAAYGHNYKGERYIPVLLKDVAGLVPGAWEGKGRGNRFLNDLLDADVLIHVIDVSGTTNEKGEATHDYDPADDVRWLQQELHQWIYQNVYSRWDAIRKRPSKLVEMFTGYHANKATIHAALHNAGVGDRELSDIMTWEDHVLHRVVDSFLRLRFPMLLALNKADKRTSVSNIQRLKNEMPNANMIAVCSKTECKLQKLKKDSVINYEIGSGEVEIIDDSVTDKMVQQQITDIKTHIPVIHRFQSTNVHEALCQAVTLRQPTYAFPVRCLDTLQSVRRSVGREHDTILRDCISLKPGTTVEECYTVLCHYPISLLTGDFVRAETVSENNEKRPVRKDETITLSNNILKIMTTK